MNNKSAPIRSRYIFYKEIKFAESQETVIRTIIVKGLRGWRVYFRYKY